MPSKTRLASSSNDSLTRRTDFLAFGKYPYIGPFKVRASHHFRRATSRPPQFPSSANHTCLQSKLCRLCIRGDRLTAYMTMAIGSPCVVPSEDMIVTPPKIKMEESFLYVLMITHFSTGHVNWMFHSATFRFSRLKALSASTIRIPSVDCDSQISFIACTAASTPLD